MTEITVRIPDSEVAQFLHYLEEHRYEHQPSATGEIPTWQQELVRERIAKAKPEDYKDWEVVRKEVFGKYLK